MSFSSGLLRSGSISRTSVTESKRYNNYISRQKFSETECSLSRKNLDKAYERARDSSSGFTLLNFNSFKSQTPKPQKTRPNQRQTPNNSRNSTLSPSQKFSSKWSSKIASTPNPSKSTYIESNVSSNSNYSHYKSEIRQKELNQRQNPINFNSVPSSDEENDSQIIEQPKTGPSPVLDTPRRILHNRSPQIKNKTVITNSPQMEELHASDLGSDIFEEEEEEEESIYEKTSSSPTSQNNIFLNQLLDVKKKFANLSQNIHINYDGSIAELIKRHNSTNQELDDENIPLEPNSDDEKIVRLQMKRKIPKQKNPNLEVEEKEEPPIGKFGIHNNKIKPLFKTLQNNNEKIRKKKSDSKLSEEEEEKKDKEIISIGHSFSEDCQVISVSSLSDSEEDKENTNNQNDVDSQSQNSTSTQISQPSVSDDEEIPKPSIKSSSSDDDIPKPEIQNIIIEDSSDDLDFKEE